MLRDAARLVAGIVFVSILEFIQVYVASGSGWIAEANNLEAIGTLGSASAQVCQRDAPKVVT
jgi:hypothetical protein